MSSSGSVRSRARIAVIGAGIVGLSTAVQIQQTLPVADVTIIADKFDVNTVSDGAAGIFRPTADLVPGTDRELTKKWSQDSFQYYDALCRSSEAEVAGIGVLSGYHFFVDGPRMEDPLFSEIVYNYRECNKQELQIYPHTDRAHYAVSFTTLIIESRWFLPFLMKKFKTNGGHVQMRTVKSLQDMVGSYDVVVNCSGLGSRQLLGDPHLVPCRGHLLRVKAPWVKHSVWVDHDCYIIPGKETITIGGTRQVGDFDLTPRVEDRERIWSRACKFIPSLQSAKIEWEWIGLRPQRAPVRLEKEIMKFGEQTLPVVHNYGHGANGIALGWGTGKQACRMVLEILSEDARQSRL